MMRLLPLEEIERLDRGVHWVRWVGDWCVFILPQLQGNVQRLIVIMRKLVVFPIIPIFLFHLKPDLFRDVTFSSELCCFSQELYEYSYFFSQYLISLKKKYFKHVPLSHWFSPVWLFCTWCDFLRVYPIFQVIVGSWFIIYKIWKYFKKYFFKYLHTTPFLEDSRCLYRRFNTVPQVTEGLLIFSIIFGLCFSLESFYCYVFKFIDIFFNGVKTTVKLFL